MLSREGLEQVLTSQPKEQLDRFFKPVPKKKKQCNKDDTLNLLQIWLHCVLYYRGLYPQQMFQKRTAYGVEIPVAKPEALKTYISGFFAQVKTHLLHISFLQVHTNIMHQRIWLQINGIKAFWEQGTSMQSNATKVNKIQDQIQYKAFIHGLKERLKDGQSGGMWKLRIGYRLEDNQELRKQKRKLLDDWVKIDQNQKCHRSGLPYSLNASNLSLIYERY